MRRAARWGVALLTTLTLLALGLIYPWMERGSAWWSVRFEQPWFLLLLLLVPVAFYFGIFGQDARRPRIRLGTVQPLLDGPRGMRAAFADGVRGVRRAAGRGAWPAPAAVGRGGPGPGT